METAITMAWAGGVLGHFFRKRDAANIPPQYPSDVMIVRRGFSPAFYFFCEVFAKEHRLEVVLDRREKERRAHRRLTAAFDRRAKERRQRKIEWRKEDFVVVRNVPLVEIIEH